MEELEDIRAELIALFQKQLNALELDTFGGLTNLERSEYEARNDRIRVLQVKLGRLKLAA